MWAGPAVGSAEPLPTYRKNGMRCQGGFSASGPERGRADAAAGFPASKTRSATGGATPGRTGPEDMRRDGGPAPDRMPGPEDTERKGGDAGAGARPQAAGPAGSVSR